MPEKIWLVCDIMLVVSERNVTGLHARADTMNALENMAPQIIDYATSERISCPSSKLALANTKWF